MSNRYYYSQKKLLSSIILTNKQELLLNPVFISKIPSKKHWFSKENIDFLNLIYERIRSEKELDHDWQQTEGLDIYLAELKEKDVGADLLKSYEFFKKEYTEFKYNSIIENNKTLTIKESMSQMRNLLLETEERVEDIKWKTMEEQKEEYMEYFWEEANKPRNLMDFGIPTLDEKIKIGAGLHIIAGLSNSGKTKLGVQILTNFYLNNSKPCLMFSLEQNRNQIRDQMISQAKGINFSKIKLKLASAKNEKEERMMLTTNEFEEIDNFFQKGIKEDRKLQIYDMSTLTGDVEMVISIIRKVKFEQGDIGMVCIDYCQLLRSKEERKSDMRSQMISVSRKLRLLSLELGIPIIIIAQSNRTASRESFVKFKLENSMSDKEFRFVDHSKHDLAESSALENDADSIIFVNKGTTSVLGLLKMVKVKDGIVDPTKLLVDGANDDNYEDYEDYKEGNPYILVHYNSNSVKFEDVKREFKKI